jgi:hypothetical protein
MKEDVDGRDKPGDDYSGVSLNVSRKGCAG